jgi:hypothetical protein
MLQQRERLGDDRRRDRQGVIADRIHTPVGSDGIEEIVRERLDVPVHLLEQAGVNARCTSARSRVWSGGSRSSMFLIRGGISPGPRAAGGLGPGEVPSNGP